ncbi:MAG: hypothetical protein WKI04_18545 [Ferruginibacter sp.]
MYRFLVSFLLAATFLSCSKDEPGQTPPVVIPVVIDGAITEFNLNPTDINTPDKGTFLISANNTLYKVEFSSVAEPASNATIVFGTDTILTDLSREFANFGKDVIAYTPVAANQILVQFKDGRKVTGSFNPYTSFGGTFGEAVITQWRSAGDPAKPNQKAKDNIINLVRLYRDQDGPGPGTSPQYLFVKVSKS